MLVKVYIHNMHSIWCVYEEPKVEKNRPWWRENKGILSSITINVTVVYKVAGHIDFDVRKSILEDIGYKVYLLRTATPHLSTYKEPFVRNYSEMNGMRKVHNIHKCTKKLILRVTLFTPYIPQAALLYQRTAHVCMYVHFTLYSMLQRNCGRLTIDNW